MNPRKFFTGRTECYLLDKLEKQGYLEFVEIYSAYSGEGTARNFMHKAINFGFAELRDNGRLNLKKVDE